MKQLNRSDLAPRIGRMEQLASIRRLAAEDGKGRGMRVWEVNNGSGLSFTVYPDRGLDIGQTYFKGVPVAWVACNREVAPQFYNEAGVEWLRTWGAGLLTGCGLSNVGGPGTANGEAHGLHGRLSHTPADAVNGTAGWNEAGQYTLEIAGVMSQGRVFGENLKLTRRITTAFGENAITVRDTVENCGFARTPCMLLYHINLGWPLVDTDAVFESVPHKVIPRDDHAAKGLAEWMKILPPTPNFAEQVFYHEIPAGEDGIASMVLRNRKLSARVSYRVAELPWLVQWKMMGQGEYVTGLEPANCFPEGQARMAERGLLRHLAPGESFETFLQIALS